MSAQKKSRDFAAGKVKHLRRLRQPVALTLTVQVPPPRNAVAVALSRRAASSAAGRHIRSQGATRRADKVALVQALRRLHD